MGKVYTIMGSCLYPFSDQNCAKTIPFGRGGAYVYGLYKGVPPAPLVCDESLWNFAVLLEISIYGSRFLKEKYEKLHFFSLHNGRFMCSLMSTQAIAVLRDICVTRYCVT